MFKQQVTATKVLYDSQGNTLHSSGRYLYSYNGLMHERMRQELERSIQECDVLIRLDGVRVQINELEDGVEELLIAHELHAARIALKVFFGKTLPLSLVHLPHVLARVLVFMLNVVGVRGQKCVAESDKKFYVFALANHALGARIFGERSTRPLRGAARAAAKCTTSRRRR